MRVIGVRYTELDRIEAQIEEYLALLESTYDFKPSPELKKLYREVAKKIHPDLATDNYGQIDKWQLNTDYLNDRKI